MVNPADIAFHKLKQAVADGTGEKVIDQWISQGTESEYVEFKRAVTNSSSSKLGKEDRENLAKTLSAAANSAGGIVIFGVDDKRLEKRPVADAHQFVRFVMDDVGNLTLPSMTGVQSLVVPVQGGDVVAIYVPASDAAPHQIWADMKAKGRYYCRSGAKCVPMEHWRLADMFGRRPRAVLQIARKDVVLNNVAENQQGYLFKFWVNLFVKNVGHGVAREVHGWTSFGYDRPKAGVIHEGRWRLVSAHSLPNPVGDNVEYQNLTDEANGGKRVYFTCKKPLYPQFETLLITLSIDVQVELTTKLPDPSPEIAELLRALASPLFDWRIGADRAQPCSQTYRIDTHALATTYLDWVAQRQKS